MNTHTVGRTDLRYNHFEERKELSGHRGAGCQVLPIHIASIRHGRFGSVARSRRQSIRRRAGRGGLVSRHDYIEI